MFDVVYRYRGTAARHEAAPLREERVRYLAYCYEQGAARGTLKQIAWMMLVIIDELTLKAECKVSHRYDFSFSTSKRLVVAASPHVTKGLQRFMLWRDSLVCTVLSISNGVAKSGPLRLRKRQSLWSHTLRKTRWMFC